MALALKAECFRKGVLAVYQEVDERSGSVQSQAANRSHQRLGPDDVHDPCQIIGQDRKAISAATFGSVLVTKCVAPMRAFIVPNRCSTRLATLAHGEPVRIKALLHASSRCSCSHRGIRRSGPVVHWDLNLLPSMLAVARNPISRQSSMKRATFLDSGL